MNKSSTDAEVSAVHSKTNILESMRELHIELTGVENPITIYQDNKSAIHLMTEGTTISNKAKHMKVRYFYVKEKVDENIFKLEYIPTKDMIADLLTKPLYGAQFDALIDKLFHSNDLHCNLFIGELN